MALAKCNCFEYTTASYGCYGKKVFGVKPKLNVNLDFLST